MRYFSNVDDFLDFYFNKYIGITNLDFADEDGLDYLLWEQLLKYIEENKTKNPELYCLQADLYYRGKYVEEDYQKARELFDKGIELGSLYCMYRKANLLIDSIDLEYEEAFALLKKASDLGFAPAINTLGWMYLKGLGGVGCCDEKTANELFQKSAILGYAAGMNNYALYIIKTDTKKALELLEKSAGLYNTGAIFTLGVLYYKGEYIEQDYQKAYNYFVKAALDDNDGAFRYLGFMYEEGKYVKKNIDIAIFCYKESHRLGNRFALRDLASLLNSTDENTDDL